MALTPEQLAALAASGRDPSQREQIIASANVVSSPYAVKNWLSYGMGSSKGYKDDTVPLYVGGNYTLVDNKTGEVLARGSTAEEIQKIQSIVDTQLAPQGRKADWRLYSTTPDVAVTNMHETTRGPYLNFSAPGDERGVVVAGNTPDASTLQNIGKAIGTALPLAVSFIPGVAQLSQALQVGVGAGAGGVGAGLRGGNILKGALMGGATAAGGQYLGGATGPLSKLGLATDVATAVGTGLGATGGGLATGQSLKNSLIGGVTAGGMQYLGGKLFGPSQDDIINKNVAGAMRGLENGLIDVGAFAPDLINAAYTGAGVLDDAGRLIPFSTDGALPAPWANGTPPAYPAAPVSSTVDPAMVVTGTRLPGPNFAGASNLFTPARYSGDGPTPSDYTVTAKKEVPATEDRTSPLAVPVATTTGPETVVTAKKEVPAVEDEYTRINTVVPDFNAGLSDEIKVTAPKKEVIDLEDKPLAVNLDVASSLAGTGPKLTDKVVEPKSDAEKISDYLRLAGLGLGLVGSIAGGGGKGGGGTGSYSSGRGALNPIFSAKLPTTGTGGGFTVGGLGGTAGGVDPLAVRPTADWYRYATGPAMDIPEDVDLSTATSPYAGFGPGTLGEETFKEVTGMSHGGPMGYARGSSRDSFAVEGPGTGRSDDIPAVLSDGEYVIDAETVALLGDGSSRAGAKKLDELRVKVRKHKGKNLAQGKFSVNAKHPEAYMLGGRI